MAEAPLMNQERFIPYHQRLQLAAFPYIDSEVVVAVSVGEVVEHAVFDGCNISALSGVEQEKIKQRKLDISTAFLTWRETIRQAEQQGTQLASVVLFEAAQSFQQTFSPEIEMLGKAKIPAAGVTYADANASTT